ncbi:MAG: peptidase U61 [Thermonema sp.]|uniref:S66 peptidase family protein n=1 Tax=Thermonema sp. TaxID=2231181 RepID=UPI0021DE30CE|nr:LD-carboxypeptidase [Thermonema sp.]GIV39861.1 MAG: peptidase U61 [Thermonema sp.]
MAARVAPGIQCPAPVPAAHTIALWAAAFAPSQDTTARWKAIEQWCRQHAWQCFIPPSFSSFHAFAGTATERIRALQSLLAHPQVAAIWAVRGGYGSYHLLEDFPIEQWRKKMPWLIGFSDLTALQLYLIKQGIASLHAPMPSVLHNTHPDALRHLATFLQGGAPVYTAPAHPLQQAGEAEGCLIGGNLAVLCSLIGTPFMPELQDCILFIEEVGEHSYAIDRMLHHLHYAFPLHRLRGLIIGAVSRSPDGESQEYLYKRIAEIVQQKAPHLPFCLGFPVGHENQNYPMLQGAMVRLSIHAQGCTLSFQLQ